MSRVLNAVLLSGLALATQALADDQTIFPERNGGMGCIVEQITNAESEEFQVQGVSWDGVWLSYAQELGQDEDGVPIRTIHLLNLRTGEKKILDDQLNNSGAFSPDGRYLIAAVHVENGRTDIYLRDLDTGHAIPIAPHEHWDWLPSFSPDGSTIVFNSYRIDEQAEIFLYERNSGSLKRLTHDPRYDAHGEFSPDGTKILFHRMVAQKEEGGYDFELFVIDLEIGKETQITAGTPYEESYASWAPDGAHVVFSSDQDGKPEKHNLYVLGLNGDITARLTRGDWKDSYAFWSRDGEYIYFNSNRDGPGNVFRIPMDGLNCVMSRDQTAKPGRKTEK